MVDTTQYRDITWAYEVTHALHKIKWDRASAKYEIYKQAKKQGVKHINIDFLQKLVNTDNKQLGLTQQLIYDAIRAQIYFSDDVDMIL